jgi:hypothetical protein
MEWTGPEHPPRTMARVDQFPTAVDALVAFGWPPHTPLGVPRLGRYIGVWYAPEGHDGGRGPWHVFTEDPRYWMHGWTVESS